ncbi:MAG: hypothetical protein DCC75_06680 [Proteobacteria bacterium]|nr:MAG: hypothetical protein DCC75_06680 [Pseudomonadota bacterium]
MEAIEAFEEDTQIPEYLEQGYTQTKVSRGVKLQGGHQNLPALIQNGRQIGPREISRFVAALEERLLSLQRGDLSRRALAQEVLAVLKDLLAWEVSNSSLEEGCATFFQRLQGNSAVEALFRDLYREARIVTNGAGAGTDISPAFGNPAQLVSELETIISWYSRRKLALAALWDEQGFDSAEERLFNLEIAHDRVWCGLQGFEVSCGLRLLGRGGQHLWLKAYLKHEGRAVKPADDFSFWVDDTDAAPSPFELPGEKRKDLCSMVPVMPRGQRVILDAVKVFVPYAALNLPAGKREVEVELDLQDEHGNSIVSASIAEQIYVEGRHSAARSPGNFPSPQALGIWPKDTTTGDQIFQLEVRRGYRESSGQSYEVINVSADIDLFGHLGEEIVLECRVLNRDGILVESKLPSMQSKDGTFSQRLTLNPQRQVVRYFGLQIPIPLHALDLEPGRNDVMIEVCILAPDSRVLCGTLERFACDIADRRTGEAALIPVMDGSRVAAGGGLGPFNISALEVSVKDRIRAALACTSDSWEKNAFRVIFSLEGADGTTLLDSRDNMELSHTICIGGFESEREQTLITYFDSAGISAQDLNENKQVRLRARVATLSDQILINEVREIAIEADGQGKQEVMTKKPSSEVYMVDLICDPLVDSKFLPCSLAMNMNFAAPSALRPTIYYELVDSLSGAALASAESEQGDSPLDNLSGSVQKLDFTGKQQQALYRGGSFQVRANFSLDLSVVLRCKTPAPPQPDKLCVKVMLFSQDGRLIETREFPVGIVRPFIPRGAGKVREVGLGARIETESRSLTQEEDIPSKKKGSFFSRMLGVG